MTVTLNVRVDGDYRATIVPTIDDNPSGEPVYVDGPSGSVQLYFQNGQPNTFLITEEPMADAVAREQAEAADTAAKAAADAEALASGEVVVKKKKG